MRPRHDVFGQGSSLGKCNMRTPPGSRDARTGRVSGFQSEAQRKNFLAARTRFSDGPDRLMPRCEAKTRMGLPCRAARMRGQTTCFCHSGGAVRRRRLVAAHLSGDAARIQSAQLRSERNRLRVVWRRDPREPGRTIILVANDEESCRAWAARQGFQLICSTTTFQRSPMRAGGCGRGSRAV